MQEKRHTVEEIRGGQNNILAFLCYVSNKRMGVTKHACRKKSYESWVEFLLQKADEGGGKGVENCNF